MTTRRPTKAQRLEQQQAERRERALEQARAIGLQGIYGSDGTTEYSIEDAPLEELEAVLARKARRAR